MKTLKIGFFGNTNNYPFMLARACRRLGHDVEVIINRAEPLHRPEFRYDDIQCPYPEWIHDIPLRREVDICVPNRNLRKAIRILKACDVVILNEFGPALQTRIGRPSLALLTGSDLGCLASPEFPKTASDAVTASPVWLKRPISRALWSRTVGLQREGIQQSRLIYHFWRGIVPASDAILDELGVRPERWIFRYISDVMQLPFTPPPNNRPLRTFCATRLTWTRPPKPGTHELDLKGSDVMIRGLGMFYRKTKQKLDVQLVRKGLDIKETEDLVIKEGIGELVSWSNEITQRECWERYRQADILFEHFGKGMLGMAAVDGMAIGRPVIANGRPEVLETNLGVKSPICQATTPEEVCAHLERLTADSEWRARVGAESRKFVETQFAADAVSRTILERLTSG